MTNDITMLNDDDIIIAAICAFVSEIRDELFNDPRLTADESLDNLGDVEADMRDLWTPIVDRMVQDYAAEITAIATN